MSLYRICSGCERRRHLAGGAYVTTPSGAGSVWRCKTCKEIK
ncbi:Uncharacterised protein [Chromobacterium violaceum]|uniref:Uncharacterized protein n=1 Tax=Chromobacterium violaceum TaxID=536 RepID=A0A447TDN8_CHRVL|nr:Uncharacterised protein [Chromobacterium violaceum]